MPPDGGKEEKETAIYKPSDEIIELIYKKVETNTFRYQSDRFDYINQQIQQLIQQISKKIVNTDNYCSILNKPALHISKILNVKNKNLGQKQMLDVLPLFTVFSSNFRKYQTSKNEFKNLFG